MTIDYYDVYYRNINRVLHYILQYCHTVCKYIEQSQRLNNANISRNRSIYLMTEPPPTVDSDSIKKILIHSSSAKSEPRVRTPKQETVNIFTLFNEYQN